MTHKKVVRVHSRLYCILYQQQSLKRSQIIHVNGVISVSYTFNPIEATELTSGFVSQITSRSFIVEKLVLFLWALKIIESNPSRTNYFTMETELKEGCWYYLLNFYEIKLFFYMQI